MVDLPSSSRSRRDSTTVVHFTRKTTTWARVAMVMVDFGLLLYVIGFAASDWIVYTSHPLYSEAKAGLWRACFLDVLDTGQSAYLCTDLASFIQQGWATDWISGVQAMSILGLLLIFLTTALSNCYIFLPRLEGNLAVVFASSCSSFAASVFTSITMVVYAVRQSSDSSLSGQTSLSWAFILTSITCVLIISTTLCLFAEFCQGINQLAREKLSRKTGQTRPEIALEEFVTSDCESNEQEFDNLEENSPRPSTPSS